NLRRRRRESIPAPFKLLRGSLPVARAAAPVRGARLRRLQENVVVTLAIELYRSVPRYVAARAVGDRLPGLLAGPLAPLRLVNRDEPPRPSERWGRVRPRLAGICGSDLATISGHSSFYFSPLVSMPFVPGHEVVGELMDEVGELTVGTRVVIDPVLACAARGLDPCAACASGATGRCDRVTVGHVS